VTLQQQQVELGNRRLNLQSGMSVSANIKLRSRPVITLISDMFTKQLEGVKRFR
jgi:HlyD family secretion protein